MTRTTNSTPIHHIELAKALTYAYGIQVRAFIGRRTVLGIVDVFGRRWMWKPVTEKDDEVRLRSLAVVADYLAQHGIQTGGPVQNRSGGYITIPYAGASPGYLQPWLPGRHVNVASIEERRGAMENLAKLHQLTVSSRLQSLGGLERGHLLGKLRMKEKTFQQIWPEAVMKCKVLKSIEQEVMLRTRECLAAYEKWYFGTQMDSVRNQQELAFCHRDLAPHNMLWQSGGIAFIDFDHAGFDDPFHDVLQLASHSLFLSNAKPGDLRTSVDVYSSVLTVRPERKRLLWTLLGWPDILIRTLAEWYRSGCQMEKLERVHHAIRKERQRFQIVETDKESAR